MSAIAPRRHTLGRLHRTVPRLVNNGSTRFPHSAKQSLHGSFAAAFVNDRLASKRSVPLSPQHAAAPTGRIFQHAEAQMPATSSKRRIRRDARLFHFIFCNALRTLSRPASRSRLTLTIT